MQNRAEFVRAGIAAAIGATAIVAVAMALSREAHARWSPAYASASPEVQAWFRNQHNAQGQWCCDSSDGHPFFGAYEINAYGSVTLDTEIGRRTLPAYMVLKGANPTGHPIYWFTENENGRRDYCFAPGTLS